MELCVYLLAMIPSLIVKRSKKLRKFENALWPLSRFAGILVNRSPIFYMDFPYISSGMCWKFGSKQPIRHISYNFKAVHVP